MQRGQRGQNLPVLLSAPELRIHLSVPVEVGKVPIQD